MAIKINFNDVPDSQFELVPEGIYEAEIFQAEEITSKQGTPGLSIRWKLSDTGRIVFDHLYITKKSMWKLGGLLKAIGFHAEGELEFNIDELIGGKALITVYHDEWNDKVNAKVKAYSPVITAPDNPVVEDTDFYEQNIEVTDSASTMLETIGSSPQEVARDMGVEKVTLQVVQKWLKQ